MIEPAFIERIAAEAGLRPDQTAAVIALLDKGAAIPFIAHYRKDLTGGLDEARIERIQRRNIYYTALTNRRNAALDNIEKQGHLEPELRERIAASTDHVALDDLYLPFRKQRRTKAAAARDMGLEALAEFLWSQVPGEGSIEGIACSFVSPERGIENPDQALEGAAHILAERIAADAGARAALRQKMRDEGRLATAPTPAAEGQKTKFESYYHYTEPIRNIPSHRLLAVLRGVRMGVLRMEVLLDDAACMDALAAQFLREPGSPFEPHIRAAVQDAFHRLLRPAIENDIITQAHEEADDEAIRVFCENARNVLLAAPAGPIPAIGIEPLGKAGARFAVVDAHGACIEAGVLLGPEAERDEAAATQNLAALLQKHALRGAVVGGGPGSRELARFVHRAVKSAESDAFVLALHEPMAAGKGGKDDPAAAEMAMHNAIALARRLQDPLAELVKLEPRNIGVGQYQHDVNQRKLRDALARTLESCVSSVGVDLNTAPIERLRYVCGVGLGAAQNIVNYRTEHGPFASRAQLTQVSGIGEKSYDQCAGFLRVRGGENPLDATAIHPEAYPVVERIAEALGVPMAELPGNRELLDRVDWAAHAAEPIGKLTLRDIRDELLHPGRDPRPAFEAPRFIEGIARLEDLQAGSEVEGVVTNVTDFGAFVDVGAAQDGLVHLSELTNRFVRDPREVVKVGQTVRAKVIKVEPELNRFSLSMKALLPPPPPRRRPAPRPGDAPDDATQSGQPAREGRGRRPSGPAAQPGQPAAHREGQPPRPPHAGAPGPRHAQPQGPRDPQRGRDGDRPRTDRRPQRDGDRNRDDRRERTPRGAPRDDTRDRRNRDAAPREKTAAQLPTGARAEGMNTSLADQLAALREKIG